MPTISVFKEQLWKALEKDDSYSIQDFEKLCFDFGIELDETVVEDGKEQLKIEVGANRYDLVAFEGIALSLRVFLGLQAFPDFKLAEVAEKDLEVLNVDPSTDKIRPLVSCAVLRDITFTKERYESFIALQDKLHANLARQRSLVSIGTHDLDKIHGPFTYSAEPPSKVNFIPLNQTKELQGTDFFDFYEKDRHLGKFLPIIRDKPRADGQLLPVIRDANGVVLSVPPIINGEHSKITMDTKNIFIEITATDKTKVEIVNHIISGLFSLYSSTPCIISPVKIISPHNNESRISPDLTPKPFTASVSYLNSCTGLSYTPAEQCKALSRMCLSASPSQTDPDTLDVAVPILRADILHQADIMEDFAVAHGFNDLPRYYPNKSSTVGAPLPLNKLADIVRLESAMAGWTEALPLILCSHDENFAWLNRPDDGSTAIKLANPKSQEYQVVRTSLLPGLLKTLRENKHRPLPLKVFEAADVALKDESRERKTRNERHFAAVHYGRSSGFELVHGLLDRVMQMLDFRFRGTTAEAEPGTGAKPVNLYWIEELQNPTYFAGHAASVHVRIAGQEEKVVGEFGILHPSVLKRFELPFVVSALELNLEVFL